MKKRKIDILKSFLKDIRSLELYPKTIRSFSIEAFEKEQEKIRERKSNENT